MSEEELKQNIFMNENENGYDYVKRINTQNTKNGLYQNVGRTINNLQQENKQLKEIIQKAINRISLIRMDNDTSIESHKLLNDVLNILQGKEDK